MSDETTYLVEVEFEAYHDALVFVLGRRFTQNISISSVKEETYEWRTKSFKAKKEKVITMFDIDAFGLSQIESRKNEYNIKRINIIQEY